MAKQRTESSEGRATPPTDLAASVTPVPAATLHVSFTVIAKGDVLHRVHQDKYQPDQFNPGVHGNARFSPIQDDQGAGDSHLVWRHDSRLRLDGDRLPRRSPYGWV